MPQFLAQLVFSGYEGAFEVNRRWSRFTLCQVSLLYYSSLTITQLLTADAAVSSCVIFSLLNKIEVPSR
jgi:hypothetical protein